MVSFNLTPLLTYITYYLVYTYNKRTIDWNGLEWSVRRSYLNRVQPGPTLWSGANVWQDYSKNLHMAITQDGDNLWRSAQICSVNKLGFGTYATSIRADINNFDPTTVLGFYVIDSGAVQFNGNEIDIEIAKWSIDYSGRSNIWYIIRGDVTRYERIYEETLISLASQNNVSNHQFVWNSNSVSFLSSQSGTTLANWTFTPSQTEYLGRIPQIPCHLCINFWNHQGNTPFNKKESDIVIYQVLYPGNNASSTQNDAMPYLDMSAINFSLTSLIDTYLLPLVKGYIPIPTSGLEIGDQVNDLVQQLVINNQIDSNDIQSLQTSDFSTIDQKMLTAISNNINIITNNMKTFPAPSNITIQANGENGATSISVGGVQRSSALKNAPFYSIGIFFVIFIQKLVI